VFYLYTFNVVNRIDRGYFGANLIEISSKRHKKQPIFIYICIYKHVDIDTLD